MFKSIVQLLSFYILAHIVPLSDAMCHLDDLKKDLEEITELHRESIDVLMKVLKNSSHNTITSLDLGEVLHTRTEFSIQKAIYVTAAKEIYEIAFKLDNFLRDSKWTKFREAANKIRNKVQMVNLYCFLVDNIDVDLSGGEDVLIEKLLRAVLEMFIAETFINEHFNHLVQPNSKI